MLVEGVGHVITMIVVASGLFDVVLTTASYAGTVAAAPVDCGPAMTLVADADAWIDQNGAANNFGTDSILKVKSHDASDNFRALVRFTLPGAAPDGCKVGSARLRLYAASWSADRFVQALRLAGEWSENTVTWNNQPATTGPAATTPSGFDYRRWDVTAQAQAMFAEGNYGFLIRDETEGDSGFEEQFHSREKGENPPELVLEFVPIEPPDTTSPDTAITPAPTELTLDNSASLGFTGGDDTTPPAQLAFECRLDSQAEEEFIACASPTSYAELSPGEHTFEVRAVDQDGKADPTPAGYTWTILPPGGGGGEPTPTQVSCGQVLTASTQVENDLSECPEDGLIIGADGIILDLNGHTIDGVGLGLGIRNDGYDSVTVKNGTVRDFDYGVRLSQAVMFNVVVSLAMQNNQVAGVELSDPGTYGNQLRDNTVANNAHGIALLDGTTATLVLDNLVSGNSGVALLVQAATGNLLGANEISGGSDEGVLLGTNGIGGGGDEGALLIGASRNILLDNVLMASGDGGFLIVAASNDNRLRGNFVSGTGDAGFVIQESHGNQLIGNIVMGTGDAGFVVKDSDGNQLINNTAHDNSDSGIALDTANDNIVRGNDVRFNPGGLDLEDSSRNLIEANDASLTTGIGIELGPASLENRVVLNKASGNGAHGIYVGEEAPEGLGSLIEHNTASGNAGDGIHVAKGGHTISANVAHDNAGWGIYAAGGSIDGGANIGRGNGEPGQCFNVVCAVDTTIDSGPDNPTTSTSATFTFSANDPGATFECALDDASFAACASPVELSGLAVGAHTFEVRAIDMVGNIDPTPASYTWTVRLMPFSMFLPVVVN